MNATNTIKASKSFNARQSLIYAAMALSALPGLLLSDVAYARDDDKNAEEYRCLEPRKCQFEQWFVNVSVGLAQGDITEQDIINDAATAGFDIFDVDFDDERTAWKIGFGMHMNEHLELEAGYVDLGEVETAFSTLTTTPDDFFQQTNDIHPLSADGGYLSAKYKIINNVDWQLALKAGLFFWSGDYDSLDVLNNAQVANESDDNGTDLFYGLGLSYSITEQLNLMAEFERFKFGDEEADVLSIGIRYYF